MSTYVSLLRYTQKGIESIKQSPTRLDAAKKTFRDAGADFIIAPTINEEVAEVIGASLKTVKRDWAAAKTFLRTELRSARRD